MKLKLSVLLLCLTFLAASTCMVSGAVIEDAIIFGDFDNSGNPLGDQLVFGPDDDMVGVWFELSDVRQGDEMARFGGPGGMCGG